MKIRKTYVLYVNPMLGTAYYGGDAFNSRISEATFGEIYDCTLSELKDNINRLSKRKYSIIKMKH